VLSRAKHETFCFRAENGSLSIAMPHSIMCLLAFRRKWPVTLRVAVMRQDWDACDASWALDRLGGRPGLGDLADAAVAPMPLVGISPDTARAHHLAAGDAVQLSGDPRGG